MTEELKPVLEYLRTKDPESRYYSTYDIGDAGWTCYKIRRKGPGILRRMFPKTVATIDNNFLAKGIDTFRSHDTELLPQAKLENLAASIKL